MNTQFAPEVLTWWVGMSVLGVVNLFLLGALWRWLQNKASTALENLQLVLCALYVIGCASRCFVLRSDVARFAMFDSWFSTVLVGRSIATVAEVAFVAQWTLLLVVLARAADHQRIRLLGYPIVPLIVAAQCCAWYGVLTTNYIGQTIEESLWAFSACLFGLALWILRKQGSVKQQRWMLFGVFGCIAYVLFMTLIDIPNYYRLWQAKEAAGASYLTLAQGLADVQNMNITGSYEDWRYPMVWQTLYFSLAVWASMLMVIIPVRLRQAKASS